MSTHDPFLGDCPHCRRSATVARPSPLWRLALVPAWLTCGAMVFLASFVGFGLVFIAPFVLLGGACLLSALHEKAAAPAVCGACGKIAVWGEGLRSTPVLERRTVCHVADLRQPMLQSDSRSVRL